jgi:aspartate aminotransferase-like enzyme
LQTRLFTPGPTPVPPELALAMAAPLPHHRTPEFQALMRHTQEQLQRIYRTDDPVLLLTASGTGAMEAAVVNLTLPGERVLSVDGGKFGERWGKLLQTYGRDVLVVKNEWGTSPEPRALGDALRAHGARAVFMTHSETSTGALADLEAIAAVVREHDALLVVDAITSLGAHPVETRAWGIDCVVSGSQKAFMLPPGLAFLSLSTRAQARLEGNPTPRFYFDLGRALKQAPSGQSPWTPAISLVMGLEAACTRILNEGVENVWRRHQALADAVRAGCSALGLPLVARHPSNAVTAVYVPEAVGADAVRAQIFRQYGIKLAGGQDHLTGKIVRIGHLGAFDAADIVLFLGAFETVLRERGLQVAPGTALAAAAPALATLPGGEAR